MFVNVGSYRSKVALVTDIAIEIVGLPERSRPAEDAIRRFSRIGLPRLHDGREIIPSRHRQQDMDVIGHHNPGVQMVARPIEMAKRVLDQPRDARVSQAGPTIAPVKIYLDAPAQDARVVRGCAWERGRLARPRSSRAHDGDGRDVSVDFHESGRAMRRE